MHIGPILYISEAPDVALIHFKFRKGSFLLPAKPAKKSHQDYKPSQGEARRVPRAPRPRTHCPTLPTYYYRARDRTTKSLLRASAFCIAPSFPDNSSIGFSYRALFHNVSVATFKLQDVLNLLELSLIRLCYYLFGLYLHTYIVWPYLLGANSYIEGRSFVPYSVRQPTPIILSGEYCVLNSGATALQPKT